MYTDANGSILLENTIPKNDESETSWSVRALAHAVLSHQGSVSHGTVHARTTQRVKFSGPETTSAMYS